MMSWENPWSVSTKLVWRARTLPRYLLWSLVGFASGWVQTRQLRHLLLGGPALAFALLAMALLGRSERGLDGETIRRYIDTAQRHLKQGQLDQADFYLNRVKGLAHPSDALLLARAEVAIRRQRPDLAEVSYREMLTNADHTQDAQAHLQLAIKELQSATGPHGEFVDKAVAHLQQALELQPGLLVCHELLSRLFMASGDLTAAARHLEVTARVNPLVQLELARVYEKLGQPSRKMSAAALAETHFSQAASTRDTSVEPEARRSRVTTSLNWSESLVMQAKLDEAVKLLTQAIESHDSPELRRRLASIYLRQTNALAPSPEMWQKRWELVTLCRTYDPMSRDALVVLAQIAAHAPTDLRRQALNELQPSLDQGTAPPAVYYLLGTAAAESQQWETALTYLRKTVEFEPRVDIAWNNLAHSLSSKPEPEWDDAERCIDQAIRLNPSPPLYHLTRGHIMLGTKRWPEAVHELELARQALPPHAEVHRGLATAYRQLGDEDLADYHETRAVALKAR